MRGAGINVGGALVEQRIGGLDQRAGGVDDVVEDEAGAAADVADDIHHFSDVDVGAALVDDRQRHFKLLGEEAGALHAAGVRRDDGEVGQLEVAEVADQDRAGEEVIDRDVEETLNLRRVKIDKQGAVGAGCDQQVRDEL